MYYEWEWVSDLAIIPAFELFVIGVMVGMIFTLCIVAYDRAIKRGGKAMKGIDISHYQIGLRMAQVKADGNDFAIIKLTEGTNYIDGAAFGFYSEAYEMGFPLGCYCYSHATTPDEARAEAMFLIGTLNGFPMPCGLFLDVEAPEQMVLTRSAMEAVVNAFCDTVRKAGYTPGLYGSEYNLWGLIDADALEEDILVWVAHYGKSPDVACDLWQSSDSGSVAGYTGPVDTDIVRSNRFEVLVKSGYPPKEQETQYIPVEDACPIDGPCNPSLYPWPPDLAVRILQTLMQHDGFWDGEIDGRKSDKFRDAVVEYAEAVAEC